MTDQPTQDAIVTQRARMLARQLHMWATSIGGREAEDLSRLALLKYRAEIEAATIERCVGVADSNRTDDDSMWDRAADTIATAIRNLKGQTS